MAYNNNGYNRQYNGRGPNYNQNRNQGKRKNGCKYGINKNDDPYISGWKIINNILVSFYCSVNPNVGVEVVKNKQGKEYHKWLCTIEFPNSYEKKRLETGFFDPKEQKVFIPEMNLVLAPKARVSSGRGGVWFINNK